MMHETPSQAEHVISKLGGINAAARLLGHKSASTVQGWKQRGFVPANRQQEVLDAALAAGIALTRDDFVFHLRGDEGASCALDPEADGETPTDPATVRAAADDEIKGVAA